MIKTDEIVEEVRRVRDEYFSRFDQDLEALFRDLKEKEKKSNRRMVSFPPKKLNPMTVYRNQLEDK